MKGFKKQQKLVALTEMTIKKITCNIKVEGEISEGFEATTELRKGDPLPTLLFHLVLEK